MKKAILIYGCLLVVFIQLSAQENNKINCAPSNYRKENCSVNFTSYPIENATDTYAIARFVKNLIPNLRTDKSTIIFAGRTESPAAFHYSFMQTFEGLPVYQSQLKVNVSKQNKVFSVFDNSYNTADWNAINTTDFDYQQTEVYKAIAEKDFPNKTSEVATKVIAINEATGQPILVYQVSLKATSGKQREYLIAANELLFERDGNSYFTSDSAVSGFVYNPDPLTTAHVSYGGAYSDHGDTTNASLDAQRQTKTFRANFNAGAFSLKNQYIELVDLDNNGVLPVTTTSPIFDFDRSENGFEDVNAFYHLNVIRNYVNTLGFNAANQLVKVDPHGTTQDNSYFSTPNSLFFGTGGVDDAEDADVIVHEYNHFISFNANNMSGNTSNVGAERQSLDEGTCDYMAASYSKSIDSYNWGKVYNWDGSTPTWQGRSVISTKKYPQDLSGTSIYPGGTILATALMAIYNDIGKGATDSLVLQNMYSYASNQSLAAAAYSLLQADTLLFQGKYFCPIFKHLYERGLVAFRANDCGVNGLKEVDDTNFVTFIPSNNSFKLKLEVRDSNFEVRVFDRMGREIAATKENYFQTNELADGMYLVKVVNNNSTKTFKWIYTK